MESDRSTPRADAGSATDLGVPGLAEDDLADLRRRVLESVRRTCPSWLADQAEDIAHNALVALIDSLRRSGGTRRFSSIYLRKAAHGATVDEIRRRLRRREADGESRALERAASEGEDPERASSAREIGRAIGDCLGRLGDARRLAVTLFLRGCSVPEAARRLGWTTKRAEHLVYRGLRNMRECLAAKGIEP